MNAFFNSTTASDLLNLWLVTAGKGLAILLIVTLGCLALRRASASLRHLCWGLGLAAVLLLPALSILLPQWSLGLFPQRLVPAEAPIVAAVPPDAYVDAIPERAERAERAEHAERAERAITGTVAMSRQVSQSASDARSSNAVIHGQTAAVPIGARSPAAEGTAGLFERSLSVFNPAAAPSIVRSIGKWILIAWALGAMLLVIHTIISALVLRRLVARARPVADRDWLDLVDEMSDRLLIRRPVRLVQSDRITVPIVWGTMHPVLILPGSADEWTDDRKRCVVAHELAHVRRWDSLTQFAAHVACIIHWFNPLAWRAARGMRLEREKACDDLVLQMGRTRPSEYASHLLDLARRIPGKVATPVGAIAMARPSQLEGRVVAILEEDRCRKQARLSTVATVSLAVLLAVPIAAMTPFNPNESTPAAEVSVQNAAPDAAVFAFDNWRGASAEEHAAFLDALENSIQVQMQVDFDTYLQMNANVNTDFDREWVLDSSRFGFDAQIGSLDAYVQFYTDAYMKTYVDSYVKAHSSLDSASDAASYKRAFEDAFATAYAAHESMIAHRDRNEHSDAPSADEKDRQLWPLLSGLTLNDLRARIDAALRAAAHEFMAGGKSSADAVQTNLTGVVKGSLDEIERTFNVADGGWLMIDADQGNIHIESGSSGTVRVTVRRTPRGDASPEDFEVSFEQVGDKISVRGDRLVQNQGRNGLNVDFIVTVPRRFNVDLRTSGGNIRVDDLDGRAKMNTAGGNLSIGRVSGEVDGRTSGGNISVDGSNANVVVNTSGGNIRIGQVGGVVRATTSGGNISLDEVSGEINAQTSGGNISARMSRQPQAASQLKTSGGGITLYLADGIGVELAAKTSAGRVHSDIDVTTRGELKKDRLIGTINGGGPTLELDTSAGDIHIRRL